MATTKTATSKAATKTRTAATKASTKTSTKTSPDKSICKEERPDIPLYLAKGEVDIKYPTENANMLIVGPPGCGKTFSNMLPTILGDHNSSMIVDDKKGTLYDLTAAEKIKQGYKVYKFDVIHGDGAEYNPFGKVKDASDAQDIAEMLIPDNFSEKDTYWARAGRALLRDIIMVGHYEYWGGFNLEKFIGLVQSIKQELMFTDALVDMSKRVRAEGKVRESVAREKTEMRQTTLADFKMQGKPARVLSDVPGYTKFVENRTLDDVDRLILKHQLRGLSYPEMDDYFTQKHNANSTFACIKNQALTGITTLCDSKLYRMTNRNDINFDDFVNGKCILYMVSSDVSSVGHLLVQMLYAEAISHLTKRAVDLEGCLPIHIRFLIDDFASGVRMKDFENVLANCRSRNMSFMLSMQSVGQLRALYANTAESIMDCCDIKLLYSTTSPDSSAYFSRILQIPEFSIITMPTSQVGVSVRGKMPFIANRFDTPNMREYLEAAAAGDVEVQNIEKKNGNVESVIPE